MTWLGFGGKMLIKLYSLFIFIRVSDIEVLGRDNKQQQIINALVEREIAVMDRRTFYSTFLSWFGSICHRLFRDRMWKRGDIYNLCSRHIQPGERGILSNFPFEGFPHPLPVPSVKSVVSIFPRTFPFYHATKSKCLPQLSSAHPISREYWTYTLWGFLSLPMEPCALGRRWENCSNSRAEKHLLGVK